mmetsp:Transcript_135111/g.431347  ORF Transcript_135111/g.431347 Transcript_135111/m.431347 type:complete len:215 (+) Transcript_135111:193-837(+)
MSRFFTCSLFTMSRCPTFVQPRRRAKANAGAGTLRRSSKAVQCHNTCSMDGTTSQSQSSHRVGTGFLVASVVMPPTITALAYSSRPLAKSRKVLAKRRSKTMPCATASLESLRGERSQVQKECRRQPSRISCKPFSVADGGVAHFAMNSPSKPRQCPQATRRQPQLDSTRVMPATMWLSPSPSAGTSMPKNRRSRTHRARIAQARRTAMAVKSV